MTDNIVQFRKKKPVQPQPQTPPWLKKLLAVLGVAAAFALAYIYFSLTGPQA